MFERIRDAPAKLYGRANAFLILFDLSRKETFERLDEMNKEVDKYATENAVRILIGAKSDLPSQVTPEEIQHYADSKNFKYLAVSSKNNTNVQSAVEAVCAEYLSRTS